MAISYIGVNSVTGTTGALTCNIPSGTPVAGDIIIAFVQVYGTSLPVISNPDAGALYGWNTIGTDQSAGSYHVMRLAWKIFETGEASYTFTSTNKARFVLELVAIRGCSKFAPIHRSAVAKGTTETTITVAGVTTTLAGCLLLGLGGTYYTTLRTQSGEAFATAGAAAEVVDTGNRVGGAIAWKAQAAAGATGNYTSALNLAGTTWHGAILALQPLISVLAILTPAGVVPKKTSGSYAGSLASSGAAKKKTILTYLSALTFALGDVIKKWGIEITYGCGHTYGAGDTYGGEYTEDILGIITRTFTAGFTATGAMVRKTSCGLAGAFSASGITIRAALLLKVLVGSITSAGAVIRKGMARVAGAFAPSGATTAIIAFVKSITAALSYVGTLTKKAGTSLGAGLVTTGLTLKRAIVTTSGNFALSATVALISIFRRILSASLGLAGDIATIFTSGAQLFYQTCTAGISFIGEQIKGVTLGLAGAFILSGGILKSAAKVIAGIITLSGLMSAINSFVRSLSGVFNPAGLVNRASLFLRTISGALTASGALRYTSAFVQAIAALLAPVGDLVKLTAFGISGLISASGSLARGIFAGLTSALSFLGDLATYTAGKFTQSLFAGLTLAGEVPKLTATALSAGLTSAGGLVKSVGTALAGALSTAGEISTAAIVLFYQAVDGGLVLVGGLFRGRVKAVTGVQTLAGGLWLGIKKNLVGALSGAGEVAKSVGYAMASGVTLSGNVIKSVFATALGILSSSGNLIYHSGTAFYGLVISATLAMSGSAMKVTEKLVSAGLQSFGGLSKTISKAFAGLAGLLGYLVGLITGLFDARLTIYFLPAPEISLGISLSESVDFALASGAVDLELSAMAESLLLTLRSDNILLNIGD